jgi:hypothetical protein
VLGKNLRRRHLDESQRAMIAAKIANLAIGVRSDRQGQSIDRPSMSAGQAAKALNVGTASVQRAKTVIRDGTPELVAAVEAGEVPVSAGAQIAKESFLKFLKFLALIACRAHVPSGSDLGESFSPGLNEASHVWHRQEQVN